MIKCPSSHHHREHSLYEGSERLPLCTPSNNHRHRRRRSSLSCSCRYQQHRRVILTVFKKRALSKVATRKPHTSCKIPQQCTCSHSKFLRFYVQNIGYNLKPKFYTKGIIRLSHTFIHIVLEFILNWKSQTDRAMFRPCVTKERREAGKGLHEYTLIWWQLLTLKH